MRVVGAGWWKSLLLALSSGTAGAMLIAWLTFHTAIVVQPDCKPSQGDGQCGFATFTNLISALAAVCSYGSCMPVAFILLRRLQARRLAK